MIAYVLENIREYIEIHLQSAGQNNWDHAWLGAIDRDGQESEGIYISLLRIEEETTTKKQTTFYRTDKNSGYYAHPEVNVNLYILISSYIQDYTTSLHQLSIVIQALNQVQELTAPHEAESVRETQEKALETKAEKVRKFMQTLSIEMLSLNAEQHNSLWQTLCGKMQPSVCYKVRMITINDKNNKEAALVQKVQLKGKLHVSPGPSGNVLPDEGNIIT